MFAGAAREAVFSRPEVIARIREDFVPVALKAAAVNNPPATAEGRLYAEIGRSKPAPQGICVADSAGKVLTWALSFDDEKSIVAFLDRCLARYRDAKATVTAERYRKYPSLRLADVTDIGAALPIPKEHDAHCLGRPRRTKGTVVARVVGRTLEDGGKLCADTKSQERYVEDLFDISPALQASLAEAVADTGRLPIEVPSELARLFATYAYLGQLDVRPVSSPVPGHRADRADFAFRARPAGEGRLKIEGTSHVASSQGEGYRHEIRLTWEGFVELKEQRIVDLVLLARGTEKLKAGNPRFHPRDEREVEHLMAGRPLDVDVEVRYGIVGTPIPDAEAVADAEAAPPPGARGQPPASLRGKMRQLQAGIRRWRGAGRDLQPVGRILREFEPLMRAGKFDEAERVLDRALAVVAPPATDAEVLRKLNRLTESVQRLLEDGKLAEANRLLDEALKLLEDG